MQHSGESSDWLEAHRSFRAIASLAVYCNAGCAICEMIGSCLTAHELPKHQLLLNFE